MALTYLIVDKASTSNVIIFLPTVLINIYITYSIVSMNFEYYVAIASYS